MEVIKYDRQLSKQMCLDIVDILYTHKAFDALIVQDIIDWIERSCFDAWYVKTEDYEIEFGFICPFDDLLYCNKWGFVL
jgi:hypothetical protein